MKLPFIFRPSQSLAGKLTLWVTAPMLVIFIIITIFIYRSTANGIYMEANARYQGLLAGNNEHVNATLKAVEVAISNAVPLVEENLDRPDHLYDVVQRIVALNPDIVGSAIAFEPDYYSDRGQWFSPYAYRQQDSIKVKQLGTADYEYHYMDWYQIPKLLDHPYWSEPYYDIDGGNIVMSTYSLPLHDSEGRFYAVFTADIALEWLSSMMQETDSINNSERGMGQGNAYSFIIGRGGTYIAHPEQERVLNESFFSYCMLTPDSIDDLTGYKMIQGEQGSAIFNYQGIFRIYYAPIERTGWSMAIIVPDEEIVAVANQVGLTIVCLMLLGLFIVFVVCHYAIGRMTKPLTRFADSADEIAHGNFSAPLPAVHTRDEMRRLHDSFLTMQQSLNHQIRETARITKQKGRIESELHIARSIQMAMLPKIFPPFADCDEVAIFGKLTPAKEVGGDLYDFCIRDQKVFFCIGDVSGKGVPASLVMAVTRALFRTICAHETQSERIVTQLNETIAEDNETNMFVTIFVGVLDLQTGYLDYCNAGHDAPLLISANKELVGLLPVESNLPVGAMPGWTFKSQEAVIFTGTTIFLYTDGLTEAENANHGQFGEQRLFDTAQSANLHGQTSPRLLIEQMTDAVHAFVGDAEQSDDLTMMAIHYTRPKDNQAVTLRRVITLPNHISTVPQLNEFVEGMAQVSGFNSSQTLNLTLAIEEAVVNVMDYAYPEGVAGDVNIEATIDREWLTFIITDSGKAFDPIANKDPDITLSAEERPIGGLGIFLVRQIMDKISYERRDGQNILTLRMHLKR